MNPRFTRNTWLNERQALSEIAARSNVRSIICHLFSLSFDKQNEILSFRWRKICCWRIRQTLSACCPEVCLLPRERQPQPSRANKQTSLLPHILIIASDTLRTSIYHFINTVSGCSTAQSVSRLRYPTLAS